MDKDNRDIKFIKPCRYYNEKPGILTPEHTIRMLALGKVVQINLDNCTIQRMEDLSESASLRDVEKVGLLPLFNIMNKGQVSISCIGVTEMPDRRVNNAKIAYERFCRKFWPNHRDDIDATHRRYDPNCKNKKVKFCELDVGPRCTYGLAYISILQIQNVKLNYPKLPPEQQFEVYLHSMIGMLNVVSAYELEIAKYSFWSITKREINNLPPSIKQRRKDIKENFSKTGTSLNKCREYAFGAAMDLHWLSGSNAIEDLKLEIDVSGKRFGIDSWVGTNDHKLFRISCDIHSTLYEGKTTKRLVSTREKYLDSIPYWVFVDGVARDVLQYRYKCGYSDIPDIRKTVDESVEHIEFELGRYFE